MDNDLQTAKDSFLGHAIEKWGPCLMCGQTIYLNGKRFRCWKTFGKELQSLLFIDDSINMKNPNVISDVLYGGYGILYVGEEYTIVWQHFERSRRVLDEDTLRDILEMFENIANINLMFE